MQPAWSASDGSCCADKALPGAIWEKTTASELAKWDKDGLEKARQYSSIIDTTSVMIVQCGRVVDEWGPTDEKLYLASIVKSLLSVLYGIYEFEGKIALDRTLGEIGIDDLIDLTTEEKQATVRDLLMARSGIYLPAAAETEEMEQARPVRGSHAPGSYWHYNNWDFNALGTIFTVFTGRDVYSAFIEKIARPIGMQDFGIGDYHYWYRRGTAFPHYFANKIARDLARFGLLFLREGRWGSQQIVPAK
jgi:CubicO group peptidase (beta-lactamase class C family)